MITYQFRLYPTKKQATLITQQLEVHRQLYNKCLEKKVNTYKKNKTSLSAFDLIKTEITEFKGLTNYSAMQQTVRRMDKSFQFFFRKHTKFPRFKSKNRFKTIEFARYGDGCKLKNNNTNLYIQGIGNIPLVLHRNIEYKIKTVSLTKHNNIYYANIICEKLNPCNIIGQSAVGIDFGIQNIITTSDNQIIKTNYFSQDKQKEKTKLQRKKKYKALQKVYSKIANRRKDFNHKLSRSLVNSYDILCLENLQVESIKSYTNINRKLFDIGINQLINYITYKAESAGKKVIMVNPAYTTQKCNQCGSIQKLTLNQRQYVCDCGYTENRDINAAKNILTVGLHSLVKT